MSALLVWKCFLIKTTTFHKMVSIDAKGCGALCEWESCGLHNNHSELRAAVLALKHFSHILTGNHVLIRMDKSTVVSYIQNNGRTHSLPQLKLAYALFHHAPFLSVRARHAPGHWNLRTNLLSTGAPLERKLNPYWQGEGETLCLQAKHPLLPKQGGSAPLGIVVLMH